MKFFDSQRNCSYFLHELRAYLVGSPAAPRTSQEHASIVPVDPHFLLHSPQEFQRLLRLFGLVALIILPKNLITRRIHNDGLHRGGSDIKPDQELCDMIVGLLRMLRLLDGRLGLDPRDLNQRWTFVTVVVHRSLFDLIPFLRYSQSLLAIRNRLLAAEGTVIAEENHFSDRLGVLCASAVIALVARHGRCRFAHPHP